MKLEAIRHIPKSNMCYAIDKDNLHIYLQTAKDDVKKVELIIEDPFNYDVIDDVYYWRGKKRPLKLMKKYYTTELFDYYFIETVAYNKRSKYLFILTFFDDSKYMYGARTLKKIDFKKDEDLIYNIFEYFNYPCINEEDLIDSPSWSKHTIWYQIFPDRFSKSKDAQDKFLPFNSIVEGIKNHHIFGGNLKGVMEKLDYLEDLGITGIYFTPIFKSPTAHKYDTEDYFTIDPSFGTKEDLKLLVKECHKRNIKVMLDAVFNHCGWNHFMWQDVIKNKKLSKYYDCFYINGDPINFKLDENNLGIDVDNNNLNYRTFAFAYNMPKWNTSNEITTNYLLDVATYWIKECDIDGWRLDVSNEVSHTFWRKFKKRVRAVKEDVYILGENWDFSNPWLLGDQMDAVMNYEIAFPIWQFFDTENRIGMIDALEFKYKINNLLVQYPKNVSPFMFNLVDSHDTERILNRVGNNKKKVKLIYLFLFSFTGSPSIYYGGEIGLTGAGDPDCRRCMIWEKEKQDLDLFNFLKKLIKIKKSNNDFLLPDITWHYANNKTIIYQKGNTFIFINNQDEEIIINLNETMKNSNYYNLFTELEINLKDTIYLGPNDFLVLQKK